MVLSISGPVPGVSPDGVFSNNVGTERMRITDAGNVGIGIASPSVTPSLGMATGDRLALWDQPGPLYGFGIEAGELYAKAGDVKYQRLLTAVGGVQDQFCQGAADPNREETKNSAGE